MAYNYDHVRDAMHDYMRAAMASGFKHASGGKNTHTVGHCLSRLGRVTDAEFEVIEPTKSNDEHRDESAGDGTSDHGPTIINRPHTIFTGSTYA